MGIIIFLILSFLIFLFCIFEFAREDFILLRKNISLEQIFNLSFLSFAVAIFFARFFYVLFHFKTSFFNPLVFFLFSYFPGLSLFGGIIGVSIFLFFYSQKKKMPSIRLFDLYTLSFLPVFGIGEIIWSFIPLFTHKYWDYLQFAIGIVSFILFYFVNKYFLRNTWKDGTTTLIIIWSISFLLLLHELISSLLSKKVTIGGEDLSFLILLFAVLLAFVKQEVLRKKK